MADQGLHYTVDFEPDDAEWWPAVCVCGKKLGVFPTAEDACDALMQHARVQGYLEAKRDG